MAKAGRRRQDHLARQAKSDGYAARSVYKLQEIDRKYRVLRRGGLRVLDLGAAPGSWSQYAVAHGATVVAVDLQELSVGKTVTAITGDFTESEVIATIRGEGPFDIVMSDAAPSTTGNKIVDTGRSEALVDSIVASLPEWLHRDGVFIAKIFQGGGEQRIRRDLTALFQSVTLFRPKAVRNESFETYLVARGYRGDGVTDGATAGAAAE